MPVLETCEPINAAWRIDLMRIAGTNRNRADRGKNQDPCRVRHLRHVHGLSQAIAAMPEYQRSLNIQPQRSFENWLPQLPPNFEGNIMRRNTA
jgi:hypothetical protein